MHGYEPTSRASTTPTRGVLPGLQEGGGRAGQVDFTIEYYTMGHLTKFVKPGAYRIESTANSTVQNVAYVNPDGSKALIAHNGGSGAQTIRVVWGGQ